MKRSFLMVCIFIISIGGGMVPAQEVKIGDGTLLFSGKVASGVFFDSDDAIKETSAGTQINSGYIGPDGRVKMWNESDNDSPLRMDLTAAYELGNIGFKVRLRADNDLQGLDNTVIGRFAYGWVNLFDDNLKFIGGFIDLTANVWGTLGDGDWDIGGNGIRVEVKPLGFFKLDESAIGSLNIGAFLRIPVRDNPNTGRDDQGKPIYRTVSMKRVLGETVFGFRYTHPWFYTGLQLELDSDIDGVDIFEGMGQTITPGDKVWSPAEDETRLMFGAGFTMLPELTVSIEGNFEGLGNWAARGKADLRQTASYTLFEKLTIGIKAQEIIWGYDIPKHVDYPIELSPWVQFKPFVNYRVTNEFTAGLEGGYGFGHLVNGALAPQSSNNGAANNKDRRFVNEKYDIYVKPNLAYNFSNGLALKAWYKATFIGYDNLGDDPMFSDLRLSDTPVDKDNYTRVDSLLKHQIALEFIWSF
ncbi:hypothetical protein [Leadbettera azotonutricia]|uniref:Uncharacterized protein n=1 Tax=Leadbettera azotonutricia (strain ATCC BAA-888 / DSM 13862 / ZAS-9) TaxID=545695 RepID=F5YES5_LEAAZ|nr:hypothetical protein [Leadbettera azotonutricia]AEF82295.1 hypothetical protein TREAZ_0203 [Leadbettera azotonutricia ZAS-9]